MSGNPLKLKIAYLYPDILYGECDIANISAFVKRAQGRDIDVSVCKIERNDKIQSAKYDFYYIGGTNLSNIGLALKHLSTNKDELKIALMAKVPMLAVAGGYILFSKSFQLYNRVETQGIKLLKTRVFSAYEHKSYPVCGYCDFLAKKTVVGYKNSTVDYVLDEDAKPFLRLRGNFKNKVERTEGTRCNLAIGTSLTSPILAQNPELCDFFIVSALKTKYKCNIPLVPLCDDIEWYSHKFMLDLN